MDDNIERACSALVACFPHYIDHGRYDDVIDLFVEDCTFERPDIHVHGREELRRMLNARPTNIATRHVCATPVFTSVASTEAASITYFVLYRAEHSGTRVPTFDRITAVAEYHDLFRLTESGWRIARRHVVVAMVSQS